MRRQVPPQDFNIHPRKSVPAASVNHHLINLHPIHQIPSQATVQPTPFILAEPLATNREGHLLLTEQGSAMTPVIRPNHQSLGRRQRHHPLRSLDLQGTASGLT